MTESEIVVSIKRTKSKSLFGSQHDMSSQSVPILCNKCGEANRFKPRGRKIALLVVVLLIAIFVSLRYVPSGRARAIFTIFSLMGLTGYFAVYFLLTIDTYWQCKTCGSVDIKLYHPWEDKHNHHATRIEAWEELWKSAKNPGPDQKPNPNQDNQ